MAHNSWVNAQFQNLNYDHIDNIGVTSDALVEFTNTGRLTRTLLWWDLRIAVDEDHTEQPRAPYPMVFDVFAAPGSSAEPPTGRSEDQIMTGLMCTVPTESFGKILGTSEIQRRLWVGNSGALPIDSNAERSGNRDPFSWNLRIRIRAFNDAGSPTGAIADFDALFLIRAMFLMHLDF